MAEISQATRYASMVMGAIFLLSGTVKLININNDVYTFMSAEFKKFASVFPFRPMGIKPSPSVFKTAVGIAEVIPALILIFGSTRLKKYAIFVLIIIMVGAMQTLFCLKEFTQVLVPFSHLLILIWILFSYNHDLKGTKQD
ncbi:transmembrane protein 35B-like [Lineus longissimus]|uniref:transmembrane protein 35B-like n=1 Tax=Lineus longissimus TaxID=88925 RepID=UPI002B4D9906